MWDLIDKDDTTVTRAQADKWLRKVLENPKLMAHFYDDVSALSEDLHLRPRLQDVGLLVNRDRLMRDPTWPTLPNSLRAWIIFVDEAEIQPTIDAVVSAALAHYDEGDNMP
jgi:hypothetical protein